MIIGIGTDLVDISRIEKILARHGRRFKERCFTSDEIKKAEGQKSAASVTATYAKRFAAKEACAKALGGGFSNGVYLRDIGVVNGHDGRPSVRLHGGALARLEKLTPAGRKANIHISISDEPPMAQAFVVIEIS